MESVADHSARQDDLEAWQRWRGAKRRRERDEAAVELWQLCKNEIRAAEKKLARKFYGSWDVDVSEWRSRNGLSEDDIRFAAFPAVMKAAKGFDPDDGRAAFQTYAYKFILGELHSLVATEGVLFSTTESILFDSEDLQNATEDEEPAKNEPRDMWYLLELDSNNGGPHQKSDLGRCLSAMRAPELRQIQAWLEENRERAIEHYGIGRYGFVHFSAGWRASVDETPPKLRHQNVFEGISSVGPLQAVTIRADGKKWDQLLPVQADILLRAGLKKSAVAEQLDLPWSTFKDLLKRMENLGFDSSKFTADEADAAIRGRRTGRPRKKPNT
jgi:hypothetical protein